MEANKYVEAIMAIKSEQSKIIGENISNMITGNIDGLKVKDGDFEISGDPRSVLENLVKQYATIFGMASIMVSKEAVSHINPSFSTSELPDILK